MHGGVVSGLSIWLACPRAGTSSSIKDEEIEVDVPLADHPQANANLDLHVSSFDFVDKLRRFRVL